MRTQDKFVAFVDILGFSNMVAAAEDAGGDVSRLLQLAAVLRGSNPNGFVPATCPYSARLSNDLDFQATQISDCVVISVEVSPAGIVNLANHLFGISLGLLLNENALCRGSVTRGQIHHEPNQFIGTGYERAYRAESKVVFKQTHANEVGTPFIQFDQGVVDYVTNETDECVRKMFGRATHTDGTYTAIYPFKAMSNVPSTVVGRDFSPQKFIESVRRSVGYREANLQALELAEANAPTEREQAKVRHYMRGIEEVIAALRAKEAFVQKIIDTGIIPYGAAII
jgi:hypothetical protein